MVWQEEGRSSKQQQQVCLLFISLHSIQATSLLIGRPHTQGEAIIIHTLRPSIKSLTHIPHPPSNPATFKTSLLGLYEALSDTYMYLVALEESHNLVFNIFPAMGK